MTDPDATLHDAAHRVLRDWTDPSPDSTERFLAAVAATFTGVGTAAGEHYTNREGLRAMTERENAGMSHPFRLDIPRMVVQRLGPDTAVVSGDLSITVDVGDETVVEAPRFTFVFQRASDEWLLAHFHFSVADAMQEREGTMDEFLDTRTRQLEEQVEERTNELREQTRILQALNETNAVLASELDLERLVRRLADAGRDVVGAEIGAFFYNVEMRDGKAHSDWVVSGIDRSAFEAYPLPRMTDVFRPTFAGEGILRMDDVLADTRYGGYGEGTGGMPPDHPSVRSFLSAPVTGRNGAVLGGLIFGHAEPGRFTAAHEALLAGVADQAAIAISNARLYEAAQTEIAERRRAEAALAEARDRAEAANRAKSAFLAKMSHELRTPLNGVLGYAQLLGRDNALTDDHRAGLDVIERSGRHLLTLINDVLDLAKIEAGKVDVAQAPFRLPELLKSLADLVRVNAESKGLTFVLDASPDLPAVVSGDERRVRQVLLNLLHNAVKFTERGTVTLRAAVERERNREAHVRIDVRDTGVGMSEEDATRAFRPFEQVGDASDHMEGTGLGLAISRRLVGLMGGRMDLQSVPGEGSVFSVHLQFPVTAAEWVSNSAPTQRIVGVAGQPVVLVVDDKAVNRGLIAGLLGPLGFAIVEASDGEQALERAAQADPDIILMDLVMPRVNGFEATRRLRRHNALASTPIVALSASVFRVTQEECLAIGCDAFLPKPVQIDDLLATLGRLLDLEWLTADEPPPDELAQPRPTHAVDVEGATPTPDEAQTLYDLALRGDIQGLRDALAKMSQLEESPFMTDLRRLTDQFQMGAIRDTVAPYLDTSPDNV
ncbi:MAG: hypothetical protein Rubg2KO_21770 [Rubricoccaceae bacterium]